MLMLDALRQVPLFAGLLNDTTGCVPFLMQGVERCLNAGDTLVREGDPVEHFFILLDGEMQITKNVHGQEMILATYAPGSFFGEVPLLMGTPYIATGRALRPTRVYGLPCTLFWQMIGACPDIRGMVLRKMAERVHDLETHTQRRERLVALGTLAAGFAHELNNPAAAARRAAGQLREALSAVPASPPVAPDRLESLRRDALARRTEAATLDPLAQSDAEGRLAVWLDVHGVSGGWDMAPTLSAAGLDAGWLDAHVGTEDVPAVVAWLSATLTVHGLLAEVENGAARVSTLVEAVKSYSFMDQAPIQEVDIHDGIESTLTMLGSRLEGGGVTLRREYDRMIPRLTVYGGELNEVWTSLLDNAFDAVDGQGCITIRTQCEGSYALVEVHDDGPGIPLDVLPRIFEPFFTTKNIGEGKGLGLDAAYRIVVARHRGDLRADSRPGDTCFQVRLPLAGVEAMP